MNRLSSQQRDLIVVVVLLILLMLAFPLLGSLFADHAPAPHTPTPTVQSALVPMVTFPDLLHLNT